MVITRVCNTIEKASACAVGVLVLAVTLICLISVASRYVINLPFAWAEQVCRIGLVWIIFLGAAVLYRQKRHISVDLFSSLVGERHAHLVYKVIELCNTGFFLVILVFGAGLTWDNWAQTYGALGISVASYYAAAPVAAGLLLLFQVERVVHRDWTPSRTVESSF